MSCREPNASAGALKMRRRAVFRPCIDLHDGKVKQIVGGTLDSGDLETNFVAACPPEYFARLYSADGLEGGHVIKLGPGNDEAALRALEAAPGTLQLGGGVTDSNARFWLDHGASKVIVTSFVFPDGELDMAIVTGEKASPELVQDDLMDDQVFLCVADPLLQKYYGADAEAIKARSLNGARVGDFARLPFCILSNHMGERIRSCFDECGVTPRTLLTSAYANISTTVGFQGSAAFFSSHVNLTNRQREIPENMNVFPLLCAGEPMFLHISLLRHRQRYLPHYAKYFRELLERYSAAVEHTPIARVAAAS